MKMEDIVVRAITDSLKALVDQVRRLAPTVICDVGNMKVNNALQIYASFLKSPQADTLDFCILVRQQGVDIAVSADLVRGGSGEVLGEMPLAVLSESSKLEGFLSGIREYIHSQQDMIIKNLS